MNSYYNCEDIRNGEKVPTVRLDGEFTALELLEVLKAQIEYEKMVDLVKMANLEDLAQYGGN